MIRLFKQTNIVSLFLLLLTVGLFRVYCLFEPLPVYKETGGPLALFVYYCIELLSLGKGGQAVIAGVLCFVQGVWLNNLLEVYGYYSRRNFLAAFIYILLCSLFPLFLGLHPALMANTFLVPAIGRIFVFQQKRSVFSPVFDTALLTAIASLFYFPALILIVGLFAGLLLFRSFNFRSWVIAFTGLLLPYFWAGTYYFWVEQLDHFWTISITHHFTGYQFQFEVNWIIYGLLAVLGVLLLRTLWAIQAFYFRTVVKHRNFQVMLLLLLGITGIAFLLTSIVTYSSFIPFLIPLAALFSFYFNETRISAFKEGIVIIWITLIVINQYLPPSFIWEYIPNIETPWVFILV